MNHSVKISAEIVFLVIWTLFYSSCKPKPAIPVVTTSSVTDITQTSATAGGNVTSDGNAEITSRGVCWSTSRNPALSSYKTSDGTGAGEFISTLAQLTAGTNYYVRAYATNSEGTSYGPEVTFATSPVLTASLTTAAVSSITQNSAATGGNIISDGCGSITLRGVCWSRDHNPTIASSKTDDGTGSGTFTSSITGLRAGTTYYVRSYATNNAGTSYGNELSFSAKYNLPVVTTLPLSEINYLDAKCGGIVVSDGGTTVTARGVCWGTNFDPTINDNKTSDGTGTGSFISSITNLSPGTTYYFRAYATSSAGTAYGNQLSFVTRYCNISLLSPSNNTILDNGCQETPDPITWFFDWSDCTDATAYQINVLEPGSTTVPMIDKEITTSDYEYSDNDYIINSARLGWMWRVRAYINGGWREWSESGIFDVEPLDTDCPDNPVKDFDGNTYNKVTIGTQVWLKENLKTTRYKNGNEISYVTGSWLDVTFPAYCWYNDDINNKNIYGGLYNWYAVNTGILCPDGWHVPDNSDLITLSDFLGGRDLAGGHLKEKGTDHWISPNTGADNSTGFTALPGGIKNYFPEEPFFGYIGYFGFWWSRSVKDDYPYSITMYNTLTMLNNITTDKRQGLSIRCIKDL